MASPESLFLRRMLRRARNLQPDLRSSLLESFDLLRVLVGEEDLERLIREAGLDRVLTETLDDATLERAFGSFRKELQRAIERATIWRVNEIPGEPPTIAFDVLSPNTIDAVKQLDSRVMRTLKDDVREGFRQAVQRGLEEGKNPRVVARRSREMLGLAPKQEAAVANFRRMLEEGDREALSRELRDKRFDRTLDKALGAKGTGLSEEQIEKMVGAYRRKMVAFNAETNARTAALGAQKRGNRLGWERMVEEGRIDATRIRRRWQNVGDSRVRPLHQDPPEGVNGEVVGFYEEYSTGELIPGEETYNCRCVEIFYVVQDRMAA